VVCVRHVLDSHLVLQFNCTNTVKEQVGGAAAWQAARGRRQIGLEHAGASVHMLPHCGHGIACRMLLLSLF